MPKLKTKKGIAKRFKLTKRGKLKHPSCGKSHLLSGKKPKRIRSLRRSQIVENRQYKQYLKRMLPYG